MPSVPNRRGTVGRSSGKAWLRWLDASATWLARQGAGLGEGGGGLGDAGGGLIVTVIGLGLAPTRVSPVWRFAPTSTSWLPTSRPLTSRVTTRSAPESRSRSAIEPPIVTRTRS